MLFLFQNISNLFVYGLKQKKQTARSDDAIVGPPLWDQRVERVNSVQTAKSFSFNEKLFLFLIISVYLKTK